MNVYDQLQDPEKRLVLTNIRHFWKDEPSIKENKSDSKGEDRIK